MPCIDKRIDLQDFVQQRPVRFPGPLVFTNGCFDLLHVGHIDYLCRARALGSRLLVAVNSDDSVRRLKGPTRPVVAAGDRMRVLSALECVDHVVPFDQDTPLDLIRAVHPDILVKGGDWPVEAIVGRDHVQSYGGQVFSLPVLPGYSTSTIIERILSLNRGG